MTRIRRHKLSMFFLAMSTKKQIDYLFDVVMSVIDNVGAATHSQFIFNYTEWSGCYSGENLAV